MKVALNEAVVEALEDAPAAVRKAFYKQIGFLVQDLHHPSLRAKKYDAVKDVCKRGSIATGVSISRSPATRTGSWM